MFSMLSLITVGLMTIYQADAMCKTSDGLEPWENLGAKTTGDDGELSTEKNVEERDVKFGR